MSVTTFKLSFRFSDWILRNWGAEANGLNKWGRVVNTDFSGPITLTGKHNSKNDVVWTTKDGKEAARELLDYPEEKWGSNHMIWGGVCWKGLVPSDGPIFVKDFKERCREAGVGLGTRGGINGAAYAHMVTTEVAPEIHRIYPNNRAIYQDDGARIHRCNVALDAVRASFRERLDPAVQANKMADCWPIENVWSILGQRVKERKPTAENHKQIIIEEWQRMDRDKPLCRKMMKSIPKRFDAVRRLRGRQIRKEDYEHE